MLVIIFLLLLQSRITTKKHYSTMNKTIFTFLSVLFAAFLAVSCSNPTKMIKNADQVSVNCDPQVLECVAGKITANVSVVIPEGYFHPKAVVEVTPVLVYQGGEAALEPVMLQGEKMTNNYITVPKAGSTVKKTFTFDYVPGMEKAELQGRFKLIYKKKTRNFTEPYKVADGTNTTYMLVKKCGALAYAPDNYQTVIAEQNEAQVLYQINSSVVRPAQLKAEQIKAFQQFLKDVKVDERRTLNNTEIVAYASPEGTEKFNTNLSDKRKESATKAFNKSINTKDVAVDANVNATSIGEDWEGFKELVKASNMEDKDLVLRVLEMYSDPNVREREIRNMSQVFTILKGDILPALRRARFIANVDFQNYTNEEIKAGLDVDKYDENTFLHIATLSDDNAKKVEVYKKAIAKYNSDRAKINLATTYVAMDKIADAKSALNACVKDAYYYNTLGVIALRAGDNKAAQEAFNKSNLKESSYNKGVLAILEGNYPSAVKLLAGEGCFNEALANILTNDLQKASKIIDSAKCCKKCGCTNYLKAIIAARQGKVNEAKAALAEATKDEKLAKRAATDIEFAKIN